MSKGRREHYVVRLVPMTENEFQAYRQRSVEEYAQEHVRIGNWQASEALQEAEKGFLHLLPNGVESKNHYLFSLEDDHGGAKAGMIWFAVRDKAAHPSAFIYDFVIHEEYRRRGYGKQTLAVLVGKAKELGLDTISLHVFGHNQAAIAFYQEAGYEITSLYMEKRLSV